MSEKREIVEPYFKKTQTTREFLRVNEDSIPTYCTQAFDFSAESLSSDGGGRFFT